MGNSAAPAVAIVVFVATVVGILWRPWGIHEAWFAVVGAITVWFAGAVEPPRVVGVLRETAPILAFLAGVLVLAAVADRAGVFTWAANETARLAGRSVRRLFVAMYGLGAVTTVFFSLDTTAVILAPLIVRLARRGRVDPVPFLYLSVHVANATSLLLPVSNLTNLLVQARYELPFWGFMRVMALPAILAGAVDFGMLYWLFRRRLEGEVDAQELALEARALGRSPFMRWSLVVVAGTVVGFGVAGWAGVALWPIAVAGGAGLAVLALRRREVAPGFFVHGVSWGVIPFVMGLFVVMEGFRGTEAGQALTAAALGPSTLASAVVWEGGTGDALAPVAAGGGDGTESSLVRLATVTAVGANLINNIPMTLLGSAALGSPPAPGGGEGGAGVAGAGRMAPYALLLGVNIGPLLTVVGSLATVLTLALFQQRGITISGWDYLKTGLVVMPPTLAAALLGLLWGA